MKHTTKTTTRTPLPEPRIFKIVVREDAHEVGMVVAYPVEGNAEEANVKAQTKIFSGGSGTSATHKYGYQYCSRVVEARYKFGIQNIF